MSRSTPDLASVCPRIVPTPRISRAFNGFSDRVRLRVNVPPGSGEVAIARQVRQGIRVHISCPARQARMTNRVKHAGLDLRELASLRRVASSGWTFRYARFGLEPGRPILSSPRLAAFQERPQLVTSMGIVRRAFLVFPKIT